MKIKINDKIFCFPPYISTTWEHVKSLQVENDLISRTDVLVITMSDGSRVKIPHLDQKIIHAIFAAHLKFIEQLSTPATLAQSPVAELSGFPLKLGITGIEGLNQALQHNPAQAELPDLPEEIIGKIAAIAKIVGPEEIEALPQSHEGCNCLHCQIARAIHNSTESSIEAPHETEEIVTDEDLRFRLWDISQNGEKLYTVSNPLDSQEQYSVYLGEPIGCTCGQHNCEHVRAVLNS